EVDMGGLLRELAYVEREARGERQPRDEGRAEAPSASPRRRVEVVVAPSSRRGPEPQQADRGRRAPEPRRQSGAQGGHGGQPPEPRRQGGQGGQTPEARRQGGQGA